MGDQKRMSRARQPRRSRHGTRPLAFLLAASLAAAPPATAAELKRKTAVAFDRYARLTQARNEAEVRGPGPFFWVDAMPEPKRSALYEMMKRGQSVMEGKRTLDGGNEIQVPNGIIHHWIGAAFLPGVNLMQAAEVTLDYDNHFRTYAPEVAKSKLINRDGGVYQMSLRFIKKKIITVVADTDHQVHFQKLDAARAHCWSVTTRIQEVENAGKPNERLLPVGNDGGFLWRLYTWWRFIEGDGGTYIQLESITLTRDIPWGLAWLIKPYVNSIPRESLIFTMDKTRVEAMRRASSTTSH